MTDESCTCAFHSELTTRHLPSCPLAVAPERPALNVERHIVWVCAGCDKCQPLNGSEPQRTPCTDTSPSMNGAEVVLAEDYDRLHDAFMALYRAADDAHERRGDFPTDLDPGDDYVAAMTDLGNALIAYEPQGASYRKGRICASGAAR